MKSKNFDVLVKFLDDVAVDTIMDCGDGEILISGQSCCNSIEWRMVIDLEIDDVEISFEEGGMLRRADVRFYNRVYENLKQIKKMYYNK